MPFKNRHPLFFVWANMVHRCTSPKNSAYQNYGGRGITVCAEWLDNFQAFLADMEASWEHGLTLDRKDVNGNYEPGNCRWATSTEQARNRSNNKLTPQAVALIRAEVAAGHRNKSLVARKHGVSPAMVRKITSGAAWK
mgnify:CR=1 FL=1